MVEVMTDGAVAPYADFDNRYLRRDGRFGINRAALTRLPVIDITCFRENGGVAARRAVAAELRAACVDIGFLYLVGHGIPQSEFDELVACSHRFFELPLAEKMRFHAKTYPGRQGFMQTGGLDPAANPDKAADLKERFSMSRPLFPGEVERGYYGEGQSRYPEIDILPGFSGFVRAHMLKRAAAAQSLVRAFALSLDLPEDYFGAMYAQLCCNLLINYYPPLDPAQLQATQWSFSPHTDYGVLTLLSQDEMGGLEVRNAAGDWIEVPPLAGSLVVNIGDMLAMWTNDLYTSNLHRAANTRGAARVSAAFFTYPAGDTEIRCLETCQGPDNPPRYEPVMAEAYNRMLVNQADRTGRPGIAARTAERFRT